MARGNGEGTIYQRKDGKWCGQITIGTNPKTGKPKRKTFYGNTRKEVARKMTELKHKLFTGTYIEPSNMPLKEWLNRWIEGRKASLAFNTYDTYKRLIRNHINPEIGDIKLKDLNAREIQDLLNYKYEDGQINREGGLSERTVKYIYTTLHAALDKAVTDKMITFNPCKGIDLPRDDSEDEGLHTWTQKEVNRFLYKAKDYSYYILYFLALNTGMRQGELLGLQWEDIDFDNKLLEVRRQLDRRGKFKKLKTKSGKRTIPLTDEVIKTLKSHKIKQSENKLALGEAYNDYDLVGCIENGKPIHWRNLYRQFKLIIKKAGVPDIRFHDLRHTFATLFLQAGGNIKTLQQILGHSSITITIDTYSHVTEDMLLDAAEKIQMMYKTAGKKI